MMRAPRLKSSGLLLIAVLLLVFGIPFALAQTPPAQSQSGFIYNGITHVSFFFDEYNNFGQPTGQGTDSRTELAATNASWAGVLATWYQATANATSISADSNRTPTDQAVIFAINELHAKGLKVMLKPHVDSEDGAWRGTFQPTDLDAWFKSFTAFILHYAQLAQTNNVELLCFGTEYVQLSGAQNQARWDAVIAAIRQVYTGKLVYAANATFTGDEFTSVSFWDKVDLLGIDGYFPLTNHADPTLPELVAAWRNNEFGEDLVATVQNFADAHQKPLIFTELGYKSVAGANTQPFNFTFPGAFDLTEQQNCYTAFYTVWAPENSWMLGIFWWAWPVPPPAANDTDYNPRAKPAENVLKTFQGAPSGSPTFNLAANPESISVVPGTSIVSTIAINPSGGFTSPVTLSVGGLPAGVTASLSPSVATGTRSALTLNVAGTVPVGTVATLTVTGTGGGVTSAVPIKLSIITPDFSLNSSPSQLNVHQGGSATSTINISQAGGFAGNVTLSASNLPSGVTATFSPASTTGSFSVVTFTASSSATIVSSAVMITGTSGNLSHTTSINLTVQTPLNDFSLSADSPTITQGGTGSTTVTVTPMGIFNGSVALSANGVPGGVTATFNPASTTTSSTLTFTASSNASLGIATISITGASGNISHTITIHLTVNQVQNPDFSLSASPASVSVAQGGTGSSTVTLTSLGGFTGSAALSASGLPTGVTASFSPASTAGTSTVTFTASATAATGAATVTITGTSGTLTHTTTVSLNVTVVQKPDFSLSASPASVSVAQGGTANSTISVASVGGFTGSVALSASGLPTGVTASFSPASTTGTSTLTFTASSTATAGAATVTITGTSGTLTRTTAVSLNVTVLQKPDFTLSASPVTLTVPQGGTGSSTITVTPLNGFTGCVTLSIPSTLPVGVTAGFNPVCATGASTLTFSASTTAAAGTTNVTVTGTSGALSHSVTVALTVGTGTGGVTVSTVINSNGAFFDDEGVKISNTGAITALSITISVQNTGGLSFSGQYNTVGGQITQSHSSTATVIAYQYSLSAGQSLSPGTGYLFDAQMGANGTVHATGGDTFTVTYTTGGQTFTQSGHF